MATIRLCTLVMWLVCLVKAAQQSPNSDQGSIPFYGPEGGNPSNGVIVWPRGTLSVVQGQLMVKVEYRARFFVISTTVRLFDATADLFRTLCEVRMSRPHQQAVADDLKTLMHRFRIMIEKLGRRLLQRMNEYSTREFEQMWQERLDRTLRCMSNNTRGNGTRGPRSSESLMIEGKNESDNGGESFRARRGLFNLGGEFLKSTLGLATEADLEDLRATISDRNEGVISSMKKININFRHIQSTLSALLRQASESLGLLQSVHSELNELNLYLSVSNGIGNVREGLAFITMMMLDAEDKTLLLRSGSIPDIVSCEDVTELVKEGVNVFKGEYVFPFQFTPDNFTLILPHLDLLTLGEDSYVLVLPFVARESLELFSVRNFPLVAEDNATWLIQNLAPILAVAADGKRYSEDFDLARCAHLQEIYVCSPATWVFAETSPSCTMQSVMQLPQTSCVYAPTELKKIVSRRMGTTVYLYLPSEVWAQLDCYGDEAGPRFLSLQGAFALHAPCSLSAPDFRVDTVRHAVTSLSAKKLENLPIYRTALPVSRQLPRVVQLASSLDEVRSALNDTGSVVDVLTETSTIRHQYTIGTFAMLAALGVCVVVLVVLIKFCRNKGNCLRGPRAPPRPVDLAMWAQGLEKMRVPPAPEHLAPRMPMGQYLYPIGAPPKPPRLACQIPLPSTPVTGSNPIGSPMTPCSVMSTPLSVRKVQFSRQPSVSDSTTYEPMSGSPDSDAPSGSLGGAGRTTPTPSSACSAKGETPLLMPASLTEPLPKEERPGTDATALPKEDALGPAFEQDPSGVPTTPDSPVTYCVNYE